MYQQMPQPVLIQGLPSKRPYKKLGTILEHITECINPFSIVFQWQLSVIIQWL